MVRRVAALLLAFCLAGLVFAQPALARSVPSAPPLERPLVDDANLLTPQQEDELAAYINDRRVETGHQLGVLTVPSLEGDSLEDFSIAVARDWGIGSAEHDNGVLLLVAKEDREMRIEVGYGLEGQLTDAQAGRIIRNVLTPAFRNENYYDGIKGATESIYGAISGETVASNTDFSRVAETFGAIIPPLFFVIIALGEWFGSVLARSKSWWAGGLVGAGSGALLMLIFQLFHVGGIFLLASLGGLGLLLDYLVSKNYKASKKKKQTPPWWVGGNWGGGGNSWGGGSSSGGGFGGGSFGGGGASGKW